MISRAESRTRNTLPSGVATSSWASSSRPSSRRAPSAASHSSWALRARRSADGASGRGETATPPEASATTAWTIWTEICLRSASASCASIRAGGLRRRGRNAVTVPQGRPPTLRLAGARVASQAARYAGRNGAGYAPSGRSHGAPGPAPPRGASDHPELLHGPLHPPGGHGGLLRAAVAPAAALPGVLADRPRRPPGRGLVPDHPDPAGDAGPVGGQHRQ